MVFGICTADIHTVIRAPQVYSGFALKPGLVIDAACCSLDDAFAGRQGGGEVYVCMKVCMQGGP